METASILVCEDERLIARDIEAALHRKGYKVAGIASSGEEALRLAKDKQPDLALMDIQLRGPMNGIDTAGKLMEEFGIPCIYLTAYCDDGTLSDAKSTHPLSYLLKPFNEVELNAVVEVALHRYREQRHIVSALQSYIDEHCDEEAIDQAIEREREFLKVDQLNTNFRVAANIGEQLHHHIELFAEHLKPLVQDRELNQDHRNSLQGALIHQSRAVEIIDKLSACGRPGMMVVEEVMLDQFLKEELKEARNSIGRRVDFVECFAPLPLISKIDRRRMREAFANIISNAFQANEEEPVIVVNTSLTFEEIPERFNPDARVGWFNLIEVTDFGKGLQPNQVERIFEPCYTAAGSPFQTGLGLSLAYSIFQRHGGWITVRSEPGVGTTASMYLPSAHPPQKSGQSER